MIIFPSSVADSHSDYLSINFLTTAIVTIVLFRKDRDLFGQLKEWQMKNETPAIYLPMRITVHLLLPP